MHEDGANTADVTGAGGGAPADMDFLVPVVMIMQCLRADMSMKLMWYASVIVGCDRRRSRLCF